jgi:hypothetical protein
MVAILPPTLVSGIIEPLHCVQSASRNVGADLLALTMFRISGACQIAKHSLILFIFDPLHYVIKSTLNPIACTLKIFLINQIFEPGTLF